MAEFIKTREDLNIHHLLKLKKAHNISFEEFFKSCAKDIMNNICISNGAYLYHPIEIEFYIYDKNEHADIHVYPRDNQKAGDIFFHLSGMDICFDSSITNGYFGGILIRALERENINKPDEKPRQQFGGPLTCKDEVLNTAIRKCCVDTCNDQRCNLNPDTRKRKGLENKGENDEFFNAAYRFFREDIKFGKYIYMKDETFNFIDKIKVPRKRSHKIED